MNVYFITGASKGIGFELAKQLSEAGHTVFGIARTKGNLDKVTYMNADLTQTVILEDLVDEMIAAVPANATSITLINNAGMVDPIGLVGSVDAKVMENAIALNLTAPMVITNAFINKMKAFQGTKRIMNISSGAGKGAYEGWGTYCATKAGLDHFTRVTALEQQKCEHPVTVVAIAPGIIDTGMQETIRSSEKGGFPLLDKFIEYKEKGLLSTAQETAKQLIEFMSSPKFETAGTVVDIREQ